ncbi:MAG: mechanosensitive ion channel family protein, partial [Pirellulaceae bacterium]
LNVTAIVGGMAVLGLAIAFGIQNLMRDYFSGFVILMESQYAINDVVKIGNFGGLVERVTLRLTQLRDLDGTVHFIPNGQISTVSNLTHGWSRAVFDIPVAMDEDIDRAGQVLLELGKELRGDPAFRDLILDDPEMLGVEMFTDSAMVLRLLIKTRPLRQWTVKREMLRRIKKRFDAEGIEIPFPTQVVYQRHTTGTLREDTRELAR